MASAARLPGPVETVGTGRLGSRYSAGSPAGFHTTSPGRGQVDHLATPQDAHAHLSAWWLVADGLSGLDQIIDGHDLDALCREDDVAPQHDLLSIDGGRTVAPRQAQALRQRVLDHGLDEV